MKLEEIKNKTNEAVSYLVAALESGESEVLTQYLKAMVRFHNYSFLCSRQHRKLYVALPAM
jgi:DNA-binding phage protein